MRTASSDLTARAVIRQQSLRLFAAHGPDAVTVRQIAAAAGVSPALVVHHFGSKDALRRAVDAHVLAVFEELAGAMDDGLAGATDDSPAGSAGRAGTAAETAIGRGVAEAFAGRLPADSPIPAYLRRLLLTGDPAATRLFQRWFDLSSRLLARHTATGALRPSADPAVRAAFLLANDLALVLLRDQLGAVLGTDPLSGHGLARWADEATAVYRDGLFRTGEPT